MLEVVSQKHEIVVLLVGGPYDGGRCITKLVSHQGLDLPCRQVEVNLVNDSAHRVAVYEFFGLGANAVFCYQFKGRR